MLRAAGFFSRIESTTALLYFATASGRTSVPLLPPLGVLFLSITSAIARLPPMKSGWEVLMYASSNCRHKQGEDGNAHEVQGVVPGIPDNFQVLHLQNVVNQNPITIHLQRSSTPFAITAELLHENQYVATRPSYSQCLLNL